MAGGILSGPFAGSTVSGGGMLSQRQPQSILGRLGIDLTDPSSQIGLAFLNNVISTPDASPFQGVAEAAQNGQVMQQRKVQLAQIVKKQQQEDQQSAQLKKMLAGDPMATQFLLAGQPDQAMKVYEQNQGLGGAADDNTARGRAALAQQYGLSGEDAQAYILTGKLPGSNQSVRAGVGQPIFGRNRKTGTIEPWQSMTDGSMVNIANPSANPSEYDFNPSIAASERASGAASGKIGGTTAANLPIAAQTAQNALDTIDKLRADTQGQQETFGTYGPGIPAQWGFTMPGSHKADFGATLNQAKGQAFLSAYTTLRGAGAITEVEGKKAGDALARINDPNISVDAFKSALDDFESVIRAGYQRLQEQAATNGGADPSAMPQLGGGAADPLGIR